MKHLAILFLAILPVALQGQDCDCKSSFEWVKKTFEENDAGFQYIVDKKGSQSYGLHNQIFVEKVNDVKNPVACETAIREWLSFFRKAHVEFHYTGERELERDASVKTVESELEPNMDVLKNDPIYQLHTRYLNSSIPFVEHVNQRTLYLRIPSFDGTQKSLVDSIVVSNKAAILSTENLIIDIRNGTGGSDATYAELMPLIYTNPIRMPSVEFLSTPLNNQRMYELATNTGIALEFGVNPSEEEMKAFKAQFDTLSNHIGEFVNLNSSEVTVTEFDTVYPFPKNVGVLINHNNVSTDEQFLLEARQSKKVKLFGTTTRGGLDVSNLNLAFSPCKNYVLVYALSKSLRIPDFVVDDIGILPDYFIDKEIPEHDWIRYVSGILNE